MMVVRSTCVFYHTYLRCGNFLFFNVVCPMCVFLSFILFVCLFLPYLVFDLGFGKSFLSNTSKYARVCLSVCVRCPCKYKSLRLSTLTEWFLSFSNILGVYVYVCACAWVFCVYAFRTLLAITIFRSLTLFSVCTTKCHRESLSFHTLDDTVGLFFHEIKIKRFKLIDARARNTPCM